jgi:hypothetical protein
MGEVIARRLAVALLGATSFAHAADVSPGPGASGDAPRRAEFRADRVELEPGKERLELDGNVVVAVDRYRLTSDHLSLERGPRGVVVEGSGRVALCPCPNPPVSFGFQSATVAPPTDLFLEQPTLRVAGVPVLWLPYLWLRAPSRVGLLPLRVAYRGNDGVLLGSGVHLPVTNESALDLAAAGYVRGGAELDARLGTPRTTTDVRWDYFRGGAVYGDLRGSLPPDRGATVAWSVDALRGARALRGPSMLEEVALRQDRARGFAGFAGDGAFVGLLVSASAARGGALGSVDAAGPGAHAGFGAALGESGSADVDAGITTLGQGTAGSTTLITQRGELRYDTSGGPLVASAEARTRALATLGPFTSGHTATAGLGADIALPFVKSFGTPDAPLQHWITPFVAGIGGATHAATPSVVPPLARDGAFYVASGGIRSTVGESAGHRSAVSVAARGGAVGEGTEIPVAVLAWTAAAQAPGAALSGVGVSSASGPRGHLVISEARVGREDGVYLGGHVMSRVGTIPIASRLLSGWDAPWVPWLERTGWSVGGRTGVLWTRWLASAVDGDFDLTSRTLLGVRGTLGYRHPCGCLAISLWGGHRLGRGSVDSWLTIDLAR